jgi:hypothetical protein
MHLVAAAIARLGTTAAITHITRAQRELAETADFSACAAGSPLFVVTGADPSLCIAGATLLRYYRPELVPRHPSLAVLAIAPRDLALERPSETELVLGVEGEPGPETIFEQLFRDSPLVAGESVRFEHFAARVLATERGLPKRAAFELPPNACLLTLEQRRLVGRPLPAVGTRWRVRHEKGPLNL